MIGLRLPDGELRVLCLGAHPDDIEIGCGATLLALRERRSVVGTLAVMTATAEREQEARAAARLFLGSADEAVHFGGFRDGYLPDQWGQVKSFLHELAREIGPDLIFAPRPDDAHQDHRLLAELVPTVWRDALILGYEIPKWDGDLGPAQLYVDVPESLARQKSELLTQAFPSQVGRDWWGEETFRGLMRLRGIECHARYAEGFSVNKAALSL